MRQNLRSDGYVGITDDVMEAYSNFINGELIYQSVCEKEKPKCLLVVGEIYFAILHEEIIRVKVIKIKYDPYLYTDTGGFGVWCVRRDTGYEDISVGDKVYPPGKLVFFI